MIDVHLLSPRRYRSRSLWDFSDSLDCPAIMMGSHKVSEIPDSWIYAEHLMPGKLQSIVQALGQLLRLGKRQLDIVD
jgi:hypothetical protein